MSREIAERKQYGGLASMTREQLGKLVQSLPTEQRAAFSKAASAASRHLRDSRKNYSQAFDLASAMVRNWRHVGIEVPRLIQPWRPSKKSEDFHTLGSLGISRKQSEFAQRLAEKSEEEIDEWLEGIRDETRYKLPTLFGASNAPHVSNNSGENEWYTPPEYIEAARTVMGSIDLDPASSDKAQETVKAERYYTIDDNGLSRPWQGNVWLNPPYSGDLVGRFIEKVCEESPKQFVVLVNNATETAWFQQLVSASNVLCFPSGRIRFLNRDGKPEFTPLQGQAFAYGGRRTTRFANIFGQIGFIAALNQ
jgi:phage N-6-adenine-methyltransferase